MEGQKVEPLWRLPNNTEEGPRYVAGRHPINPNEGVDFIHFQHLNFLDHRRLIRGTVSG